MKNLQELLLRSPAIVNQLSEEINSGGLSLKEAERRVIEHLNQIGNLMIGEVVEGIREPVIENRVSVEQRLAVFDGVRTLAFRNRFGGITKRGRRCYKFVEGGGGYYPLDEKLGMDQCSGFSPLMTYLQVVFGAGEAFERSSQLLSEVLGFRVSATAVQNNTEATGARIDGHPLRMIAARKRTEECELMVVEMDGTMSPQIHEEPTISGREGLKQPTEYKECNLIIIDKYRQSEVYDRWIGACYGPRNRFEQYVGHTGLQMGQLCAQRIVVLADGAKSNWEIQQTNFPGAVQILDFFHACEHLGEFCKLYKEEKQGQKAFGRWNDMLWEGEALQLIAEMKDSLARLCDTHKGRGHINYFQSNLSRMQYNEYRESGFPIGSGLVEGGCKYVIGKRFKGSGMRWKKADNEVVLNARLAKLNGRLPDYFVPKPREWSIPAAKAA